MVILEEQRPARVKSQGMGEIVRPAFDRFRSICETIAFGPSGKRRAHTRDLDQGVHDVQPGARRQRIIGLRRPAESVEYAIRVRDTRARRSLTLVSRFSASHECLPVTAMLEDAGDGAGSP